MIINNSEKEKKVIDLYKEGKTVREIAKIVHMSFGTIGSLTKKYENEVKHKDDRKNSVISEETKAIRLFSEGKTPADVKIELDMPTEEVERFYKDYWKLRGLHQLYHYYENEIKKDLSSFLRLYKRTKQLGISNEVIIQALRDINELPLINMAAQRGRKEVKYLSDLKDALVSEIIDGKKAKDSADRLLEGFLTEIERVSSTLGSIQRIEETEKDTKRTNGKNESEGDDI